ncbi:SigE family RNA polymerase sigma factor [soil metagenome]
MGAWGDPEAFCTAVRGQLVGVLVLHGHDRPVAEELAQEALVRTWQRWGSLEYPKAFALRCAMNLSRSWVRRRLAERRAYDAVGPGQPRAVDAPDVAAAVAVRGAVAALPQRQREAIVARYFADLSIAETAKAMRCAPGTVQALTAQAIDNLRRAGLDIDIEEETRA